MKSPEKDMFLKSVFNFLLLLTILQTSSCLLHGNSQSIVNSVAATTQTVKNQGNNILGSLVLELDKRVNDLILRVHNLEIERQYYANKNAQLEQYNQDQNVKIASLQNDIVTLESRIQSLESDKEVLTHNMTAWEDIVTIVKENITNQLQVLNGLKIQTRYVSLALMDVQTESKELNGTLLRLINENKRLIRNISQLKPGFTAYLGADKPLPEGRTIVFAHVYSNVGSLYNSQTGVFTADHDGLYAFYSGIECHGKGQIYSDLIKDGSIIARASCKVEVSDAAVAYGSMFSIQYLSKQSRVWVRITAFNIYGSLTAGGKTCFSGFLV